MTKPNKVSDWRRRTKATLVAEAGGKCVDCGYIGPSFHMDFDHRDQATKEFKLAAYGYGIERLRVEAAKCDLLCALCHRTRTHKQRCPGCEECSVL